MHKIRLGAYAVGVLQQNVVYRGAAALHSEVEQHGALRHIYAVDGVQSVAHLIGRFNIIHSLSLGSNGKPYDRAFFRPRRDNNAVVLRLRYFGNMRKGHSLVKHDIAVTVVFSVGAYVSVEYTALCV